MAASTPSRLPGGGQRRDHPRGVQHGAPQQHGLRRHGGRSDEGGFQGGQVGDGGQQLAGVEEEDGSDDEDGWHPHRRLGEGGAERSEAPLPEKTRKALMSYGDVSREIRACWAGDGQFFDVTGAVFGIEWASIDRIDSDGDYDWDNTRVMHVGLNYVERQAEDDGAVCREAYVDDNVGNATVASMIKETQQA